MPTLIYEVVADVDVEAGEIILVIHWKGGVHTKLRLPRRRRGLNSSQTSKDVIEAVRVLWSGDWARQSLDGGTRDGAPPSSSVTGRFVLLPPKGDPTVAASRGLAMFERPKQKESGVSAFFYTDPQAW